jgi:YgiT-type zinc finger domain-containing protein
MIDEIREESVKCEVCGVGTRRSQQIRYSLLLGDRLVVVENVPAEVCDHCGETTLSPDTVDSLQQTVWQSRQPVKVLEAPVYEFAAP